MKPIVQISLDLTDINEALETAALALRAGVDWLEAGTPLILAEGVCVGTLCVVDRVAREFDASTRALLQMLARQCADQLSLRREALAQARQAETLRHALATVRSLRALGLNAAQMDLAFPFHFVLDPAYVVVRAGPSTGLWTRSGAAGGSWRSPLISRSSDRCCAAVI